MKNRMNLPTGKLKHDVLSKMFEKFVLSLSENDNRLIVGPKVGEDAAVIDMGDRYLVAKTDPITFATEEIGYYVVNVNANDIVCTGAVPKWFQSAILLPENQTTEDDVERIFKSIYDTCKKMNITIIGGHTEITVGLDRPIVIGSLMGEVEKDKLVKTSGAEPGDSLILTKGIFIEGTSIIAREKEKELRNKGLDLNFIEKCKNYLYNPGISVLKEALLVNQHFKVKSFHDPTEGGLFCGIAEMALASNVGVLVDLKKILLLPEPKKLSEIFSLNPFSTISSGSLLIAVNNNDAEEVISLLKKNGIKACIIGEFKEYSYGLRVLDNSDNLIPLNYSERDDITKIFE